MRRCRKCGSSDLGWEPKYPGPAACEPCLERDRSNPHRDCAVARCHLDAIARHWDEDPDPASLYCAGHAWRSWAVHVPIWDRERVERLAGVSLEEAKQKVAEGRDETNYKHQRRPTWILHATSTVAEWAVADFLAGTLPKSHRKDQDVMAPDGKWIEVKCASKHWPFDQFAPSLSFKSTHRPKVRTVLCAAPWYPDCLDVGVYVVAGIRPEILARIAQDRGGYRVAHWDSENWIRPYQMAVDVGAQLPRA